MSALAEATLVERMAHYAIPGVALALITDSEIAMEACYGVKEAGGGDPAAQPATVTTTTARPRSERRRSIVIAAGAGRRRG